MNLEPKPGERLADADFENVVRLTPLISIDLIVRLKDGRVLLGHRKNEPAKGTLFVPGGRITKNETISAAFRRITLSELGEQKELKEARFLGTYDHIYETNVFGKAGFGTHYVVLGYELETLEELRHLPVEQHGDYTWMSAPQILASGDVHENTKAYLKTAP
jgi:colanic acid biosynthesis protein WcaH